MSKKIMVVDDETLILALFDIMLRKRGFIVMKASDGYTALAMLESATPDLIILDVMMPGMDGIELCRRIRKRSQTAHTPVIIASAIYDTKSVQRGFEAGANDYLSKPTLHTDLLAKVSAMLGTERV